MRSAGRTCFVAVIGIVTNVSMWKVLQTVCTGISLPLTIGLVMLLIWNLHLALHNKTTIEFHEGVTAKIQVSADLAPALSRLSISIGNFFTDS